MAKLTSRGRCPRRPGRHDFAPGYEPPLGLLRAPRIVAAGARVELLEVNGTPILRATPVRRLTRAEKIAEVSFFLLSPAAGVVTGATVPCDGGVIAKHCLRGNRNLKVVQ